MVGHDDDRQLTAICSLDDPTRRRIYDYVATLGTSVTRDGASEALSLDRSVVAYHLDKLVEEGLLAASFARPPGRTGPGAGRPAKHYARPESEFSVTVPPRDYPLAAELLARAVEEDPTGAVREALASASAHLGEELSGPAGENLLDVLRRQGYEPFEDDGKVRLRNCPFHRLARRHTELVCGMNHALLAAVARTAGGDMHAVLDPAPGRCCVAFVPPGP